MDTIELKVFNIDISMNFQIIELNNSFDITLKFLDEVIDSEFYNDQLNDLFEKIYNKRENNQNESLEEYIQELNNLGEKHLKYKVLQGELMKNEFSDYHNSFHMINNYKPESPEDQERIRLKAMLDGYTIVIKNSLNTLEIKTPTQESHPILMEFLNKTTEFLRGKYPIDFQSKMIIHF
ncbi:hypothetical protein LPB85_00150 [Chryseobacterium sp. LC2016-27]|jgi:hypothetical protein|uniref:hypothetical protein n=1 Tax=Chryseobacterium sp. LC2016-27 TaxID=2897326 RepID=UPI001E3B4C2D|nr:hypothetical protein [Chryseobacterium sp. LC2016-27]MCD0453850.1 hypothetical protein [Chryseobacterium sp. LC2016-27]